MTARIEDLKQHLDNSVNEHGGFGYSEFVHSLAKLSKQKLAAKFKVNRKTIDKWVAIHQKEQQS